MSTILAGRLRRNVSIALVFVVVIALFTMVSLVVPGFSSPANVRNLLVQIVILAMIAGGQTFAILSGGIDVSVAYVMTVSAVLTAYFARGQDENLIWVIPLVLGIGVCIGLLNGFGIGVLMVPPIIMTLATGTMLNGALVLVVGLAPPPRSPELVTQVIRGDVGGAPNPLLILILITLIMTVLLSFTPFGRRLYAVGTSQTVARFSGVQPLGILLGTYVASSVCAVIAGFLLLGFVGTVNMGIGLPYLFPSVVAVIVGGASILGGAGHYIGTVAGVILLIVLQGLLTILNLGAGAISILFGLIILVSVWLASLRTART